jgi:hypothetical protein
VSAANHPIAWPDGVAPEGALDWHQTFYLWRRWRHLR